VRQTSDAGYVVAGHTYSYGAGSSDVYLIKTTPTGGLQWSQTFGGSSPDYGSCVRQTDDGGYIITGKTFSSGAGGGDVYLVKTDGSGVLTWQQPFGGSSPDSGACVVQTSGGDYVVAGHTYSFGAGYTDVYLVKVDGAGALIWSQTFGGSSADYGYGVDETAAGGFIITGKTYSFGSGATDVYLIETNSSGIANWSQTFGGSSFDCGRSVQQTSDGGYIIAGHTYSYGAGSCDFYLVKTDAAGNLQWQQTYGGSSPDSACSVMQTADGGYVVAGVSYSYGAGSSDFYMVKTDDAGNMEWDQTFGGTSPDYGCSVRQCADWNYILTGYTYSYGAGSCDVYLVKFHPITISLAPVSPPIVIPAAGGSFDFDVEIENYTTAVLSFDAWTVVDLPGVGWFEKINANNLTIPPAATITATLTQSVPAYAPFGTYTYYGFIGDYQWIVGDYDYFDFEKEGPVADDLGSLEGWLCSGEWFDARMPEMKVSVPESFAATSAYPNPFNPTTALSIQLSEFSHVNLAVYDISGRKVAELVNGWRDAGVHEVTFDGSDLPSGVYFARFTAGDYQQTRKLLLVK
jgi:hypothetical protein